MMKSVQLLSNQILLSLTSLILATQLQAKPLQVYILAGQSNMQGHAKVTTFEHIGMDPATKPMLAEMQNPDGSPKVCERVWISSIGCADAELRPLSDRPGTVSDMDWNRCPLSLESAPARPRGHGGGV